MPKPFDFTGFSYSYYINFLSTDGKIEVTTPTQLQPAEEKIYGY